MDDEENEYTGQESKDNKEKEETKSGGAGSS